MRKYRKFFYRNMIGHFGNLIGRKVLFRFSQKCAQKKKKINVKFGVNKQILFDGKE